MYAAGRKVKRLSADDKTALKAAHRELIYDAETSPCSSFALIECPSCIFSDQCEYSTKYKYYINNCDSNPKFEIYHSRERVTFVFRSAFNCYSIAGEKLDPNEFHLMLLPCGRFTITVPLPNEIDQSSTRYRSVCPKFKFRYNAFIKLSDRVSPMNHSLLPITVYQPTFSLSPSPETIATDFQANEEEAADKRSKA